VSGLTPRVAAWRDEGHFITVDGNRVFVRAVGGEGPPILLLHGYPSSSYDWRGLIEQLAGRRIVCFDFLGFGLSDKPRDHTYSLHRQADLAETVAQACGHDRVVLVAHDMGTSVATELLARDIDGTGALGLESVLVFNGNMLMERASLTTSQKILRSRFGPVLARLSSEFAFKRQFGRLFSDGHPLSEEEAADQWCLLAHNDGHRMLDRLIYYLHERISLAPRWHGALRNWPGELAFGWGELDPVATTAVLDGLLELRPHAPYTRWPGLGHYPQVEDPATVAAAVAAGADRVAAPAR
jgi:pimeloyl-ACP methyl ester carboxylesterase